MTKKPKLAIFLSRFPFPLEKGDKLRAYYQIKELSKTNRIYLFAVSDTYVSDESRDELKAYCEEIHIHILGKLGIIMRLIICLFGNKPFQTAYFHSSIAQKNINKLLSVWKPDHIYCQLIRMSEYVKNYHTCPKTLDYMDALAKGMERRYSIAPWHSKWLFKMEFMRLKSYEQRIFNYFENHTIISEQDRKHISHPEKDKIIVVPNGVDEKFFEKVNEAKEYDLLFVGNMSYQPNVQAVEYISDKILSQRKNLNLLVSGAAPTAAIQKLALKNSKIKITGFVADIRTSYAKGKIFIAPMMIGTGQQNKILETMAIGVPCITTTLSNNAIHAEHLVSILIADTEIDFLKYIDLLLENTELYEQIAQNAKEFVAKNYTWQKTTQKLTEIVSQ